MIRVIIDATTGVAADVPKIREKFPLMPKKLAHQYLVAFIIIFF